MDGPQHRGGGRLTTRHERHERLLVIEGSFAERMILGSLAGESGTELMEASFAYGPKKKRGFIRRHLKAFVIGTALAVLTTTGLGIAAWIVSGNGNLYGKTGQLTAPNTVDVSTSITGDLFPGSTGDLTVAFSNPNVAPLFVSLIIQSGTPQVLPGGGGCDTNDFTTDFSAIQSQLNLLGAPGRMIPAGDGDSLTAEKTIVFTDVVTLSSAAPTGCQNQTFVRPATFNYSTAAA